MSSSNPRPDRASASSRLLLGAAMRIWYLLSLPFAIAIILGSSRIHPAYRVGWFRRSVLGFRMFWNKLRVPTGTNYKAHLAMALKILEIPPEVEGDVVECGCWKGGSSANLSLVCRLAGRRLVIYDSFLGLPEAKAGDREGAGYSAGDYQGTEDEVRANITRCGAIECCEFVNGWFDRTLPDSTGPIVLLFLDVDLEDSLNTCVKHLWPRLVDGGYLFTDECVALDYVALFWSERWWRENFDRTPPGLIGAGTGLPLGEFYIGPWSELEAHPGQHASTGAYTRKSMSGFWDYYPED